MAGRNGAAGAEPAALGSDPPAKLIGDRLKIQNAFEGPPPHSKCLEVKGVLGEQSRRASSIPHSPSTRPEPSQHRCWGETKAWLAGELAPHTAGPAPCWCQSPLPALRPVQGSRQQAQAEVLITGGQRPGLPEAARCMSLCLSGHLSPLRAVDWQQQALPLAWGLEAEAARTCRATAASRSDGPRRAALGRAAASTTSRSRCCYLCNSLQSLTEC